MIDWNQAALGDLPGHIWTTLGSAIKEASHPLRLASIGTGSSAGCAVRTVVLREVDQSNRRLIFYTDQRSRKISELRQNPRVAWLFYDPAAGVQIRAETIAQIHHADEIALQGWSRTPIVNRVNYCTVHAPGTEICDWGEALPRDLRSVLPDAQNTAVGQKNFAVVSTTVERFDWLWLNPMQHRRAAFHWDGMAFRGRWLTP